MPTDMNTETTNSALDGADEPCPAIGANLIARMTEEARGCFVERFADKTRWDPETGCVEWTGALTWDGYGMTWIPAGAVTAHRAAYVLAYGPIPAGMLALHSCHNRRCVNPAHLRLGTHGDNMQEMVEAGRTQRGPGSHPRKLTVEMAMMILGDRILGVPVKETAQEFGVSSWMVLAVRAGRSWGPAITEQIDAELALEAAEGDRELPTE